METSVKQEKNASDCADWLAILHSLNTKIRRQTADVSESYGVCELDLTLRVLLHLPRYSHEQLEEQGVIRGETERLAVIVRDLQRDFSDWRLQKPYSTFERKSARVIEIADDRASIIHQRFHYIGSPRAGRHFALHFGSQDIPAALVTLSEMDVQKLTPYTASTRTSASLLLSRMFCFRWAPRNTLSYLLGYVARLLHREGQIESLVTWVNPNLGFDAASYRASNWTFVGTERACYRYVGENYATAREAFQNKDWSAPDLEMSKLRLEPFQVWRFRVAP
jgi:hypothetical protein